MPRALLLLALALSLPSQGLARDGFRFDAGAAAFLGTWDDALVQETELDLALASGAWSGALHVPLRFYLASISGDGNEARFRREDWNSAGDVLRLVDEVSFDDPKLGLALRLGTLADVTLGRGEIVAGFTNNLNLDRPETGAQASWRHPVAEVRAFASSLLSAPVLGAHALGRPLAGVGGVLGRLELDATWAADTRATVSATPNAAGGVGRSTDAVNLYGAGLALPFPSARVTAVPYASVAGLDTDGGGVHVGVGAVVRPDRRFEFGLGTEYRYTWDAYAPNYFTAAYAHERDLAPCGLPKLGAQVGGQVGAGHGFEVRLRAASRDLWSAELRFADRRGPFNTDGALRLSANLPRGITASGLLLHQGADGVVRLFELERALAAADLTVPLAGPVALRAFYARALLGDDSALPALFHRGMLGVSVAGQW